MTKEKKVEKVELPAMSVFGKTKLRVFIRWKKRRCIRKIMSSTVMCWSLAQTGKMKQCPYLFK